VGVRIYPVPLGMSCAYLIQDEGIVMVDGGTPNQISGFFKAVEKASVEPRKIRLLVMTHGHWDHIGSAKAIKEITGAPIAMHRQDRDALEKSSMRLPLGVTPWGRVLIRVMALFTASLHIPTTNVDVILEDEGLSLADYGVPGRVIYTPGHSMGSVSVLLETGDAFVGDLAMNMFPLRLGPGLPIFAEDLQKVKESWQLLLDGGAKTVYPAHGRPFPAEVMRRALS